uniref:Uncharacterized protein LOC111124293 n=1 Tax=Crassostrea virginica TaxID=6565 RepID=A0A8B8D5P8_CRAVI|nr:uncharacterized protein LOC111124293 [Crassostrea virginica]
MENRILHSTFLVELILMGLNTVRGDTEINSTIHIILPENTNLVYFGVRYTDIYLQPAGILAFDPKAQYNPRRNYSDPFKPWVVSDDYPQMAPLLFNKGNSSSTSMRFKIYQISNESSRVFLDQLNDVIDKSFVGVQSTSLTFALSVTWRIEDSSCMDTSMCQNTNSSLVLATDGQLTFAMVSLEFSEIPMKFIYQDSTLDTGEDGMTLDVLKIVFQVVASISFTRRGRSREAVTSTGIRTKVHQ